MIFACKRKTVKRFQNCLAYIDGQSETAPLGEGLLNYDIEAAWKFWCLSISPPPEIQLINKPAHSLSHPLHVCINVHSLECSKWRHILLVDRICGLQGACYCKLSITLSVSVELIQFLGKQNHNTVYWYWGKTNAAQREWTGEKAWSTACLLLFKKST